MRWFVYKNDRVYGPYVKEQLAAFLVAEDLIFRENSQEWKRAGDEPLLEEVLSGYIQPKLEWFITPAGKLERGPFTRTALLAIMTRKEIKPTDFIRHISWENPVSLGHTKLYHAWKDPYIKLDDIPPDELTEAPRERAVNEPPPPPKTALSTLQKMIPNVEFSFEFTPRVMAAIIAIMISPPIFLFAYDTWYAGSDMELTMQLGEPKGPCDKDSVSKEVCGQKPALCGCSEKGSCGMQGCRMYADINKHK